MLMLDSGTGWEGMRVEGLSDNPGPLCSSFSCACYCYVLLFYLRSFPFFPSTALFPVGWYSRVAGGVARWKQRRCYLFFLSVLSLFPFLMFS